jgi:hypothetical protein
MDEVQGAALPINLSFQYFVFQETITTPLLLDACSIVPSLRLMPTCVTSLGEAFFVSKNRSEPTASVDCVQALCCSLAVRGWSLGRPKPGHAHRGETQRNSPTRYALKQVVGPLELNVCPRSSCDNLSR